MNRRSALRTLATGGAAGALAAGAVAACAPLPALAMFDPLLRDLTTYRDHVHAFNNLPSGLSDQQLNSVREATWGPFYTRIYEAPHTLPPASSLAGAVMALRIVVEEDDLGPFEEALVRAALAHLEGCA